MKRFVTGIVICLMALAMTTTAFASTMTVAEAKQALAEARQAEREARQALKAEKQAYRDAAQVIRDETKEVNAEIKEVNAQITALRERFIEIRDVYRSEKTLPEGVTKEIWQQAAELRKEANAIQKAANGQTVQTSEAGQDAAEAAAVAETETETETPIETQTEVTVKDLVAERRFDEALQLLTSKKEARLQKLETRRQVLAIWQQVDTLLHP